MNNRYPVGSTVIWGGREHKVTGRKGTLVQVARNGRRSVLLVSKIDAVRVNGVQVNLTPDHEAVAS